MADLDIPYSGEGLHRNEPIMVGSSDDEEDNIEHRRTRRLGGPHGTPIPHRRPDGGLRMFSPAPPLPPIPYGALRDMDLFENLAPHQIIQIIRNRPHGLPLLANFPPFARMRAPETDPEPYDVRMTHASVRPRLGFTFDFEQPEEEEKPLAAASQPRARTPVKFKQTIEIPDSPPLRPDDKDKGKGKGKGKAKEVESDEFELADARHKEIIEIYSDDEDEDMGSVPSSSQQPLGPTTKITSVLICAGCRRPLRTGGDRLWALRCPLIDGTVPVLDASYPQKRRKTGKGKARSVSETHEWKCPVKDCGKIHKSERNEDGEWVPTKDHGAIKFAPFYVLIIPLLFIPLLVERLYNSFADHSIGYDPSTSGFRGHVFLSHDNKTAVLSIKGTSAIVFGGGATVWQDKLNDNLLFSCCCARVDWTWSTVCGCFRGGGMCDQRCVEKSLEEESLFYGIGINLYNNLTYMYPGAEIWVIGHSLGGSLASLIGTTFGAPVVAFEAPGEKMAAQRLHLPISAELSSYIAHVYNTADPIPAAGYALETRCHLGTAIVYDTLSQLHWSSNIRAHFISTIIDQMLDEDWSTKVKKSRKSRLPWPWSGAGEGEGGGDEDERVIEVPKSIPEEDCMECFNWEYGDFPEV
ncbi:Putative lipase ATG15 [Rhizoctonia solani AG-1 IB]|uniref:triacylglycerol lipase n=1 Tax=Thanatephorus cucumeris (strain AG1-IB / isolate 7/3/14) TaxID=1108050 RepID=M5CH74_THACB|nr:Putative lipase ATG15 [Rhizoctonia solani AG-1 IB]